MGYSLDVWQKVQQYAQVTAFGDNRSSSSGRHAQVLNLQVHVFGQLGEALRPHTLMPSQPQRRDIGLETAGYENGARRRFLSSSSSSSRKEG